MTNGNARAVSTATDPLPGLFWRKLNTELDAFSVPKRICEKQIDMHQYRGDDIYFVTKRISTKDETLTARLGRVFHIANMHPVQFTSRKPKTEAFLKIKADISYGDSDGDIKDSIAAGARPIRVKRAPTSVNQDPTHNGELGEEVLENSEF